MKQVLVRRGKIAVEDVPAPLVGKGNVLVEVAYSLISTGTEVEGVRRSGEPLIRKAVQHPEQAKKVLGILAERGIKKTLALVESKVGAGQAVGYSCSGVVVQVGEGVEGIKPGDRVACAGAGRANHAEIVLVTKNLVVKIPDGCSLQDAASVALGAIAMQGVRRAALQLGEIAAVIGLGLLGQITVQLLKNAGCRVLGFDLQSDRVTLARKMGLDWGFASSEPNLPTDVLHLTAGHGVDATIITAAAPGNDTIIQLATEITRKKGRVVVIGDVGLGLRRSPLYEKELDVLISTSYGPGRYDEAFEERGLDYPYAYIRWTEQRNMEEYLKLIAEGKLNFSRLVAKVYPIEEAPQAYQALQEEDRPLAVLLDYHLGEADTQQKLQTKVQISSIYKEKPGLINVAVIGAGSFAKSVHLPNLQRLSNLYSIRAIVSATGSNAKEMAKQFGAAYCSTDYHDALVDDAIDMVMICTRHNLHGAYSLKALRAGKNVFVEKPLCITQEQLDQITDFYDSRLPRRAGTIGHLGCFSFFPTKNLGAYGDGGMVVTNDDELADKVRMLRVHGAKPKYYHHIVGYNSRLDALQAAVLRAKLSHLKAWSEARRQKGNRYDELLAGIPGIVLPHRLAACQHIFHQYTIWVRDGRRDALREHLKAQGIATEIYYPLPLHLQPCLRHLGYKESDLPESESASQEVLSLPMFPELTDEEQAYVVQKICDFTRWDLT